MASFVRIPDCFIPLLLFRAIWQMQCLARSCGRKLDGFRAAFAHMLVYFESQRDIRGDAEAYRQGTSVLYSICCTLGDIWKPSDV